MMKDRAAKIKALSQAMEDQLIIADNKFAILKPLFGDEDLLKKWDGSRSANGVVLLRLTLYYDLIRELSAISFDYDEKKTSPSIKKIITLLEDSGLVTYLKKDFCKPLQIVFVGKNAEQQAIAQGSTSKAYMALRQNQKESFRTSRQSDKEIEFDNALKQVRSEWEEVTGSELYKTIKGVRNSLVAHYEMCGEGSERRLKSPEDFDLNWDDAQKYFEKVKPIIENILLIIHNRTFLYDESRDNWDKIADEFWHK